MTEKLKKSACFTDIHWGARTNSEQHNIDCTNFISWFCDSVKADPSIDHIVFLGDWHENRSALNVSTLMYSFNGAKMLNDLGIPVFFIIGNHDLYYRNTRDIFSSVHFNSFSNFRIIDEPTLCEETYKPILLCPYLFHHEYPSLANYINIPIWYGHFEFQGFVITGYNNVLQHGPNSKDFKGPDHIFSGHFHKRQAFENVMYIGNAFPTNFGDAGDDARGMITYDYVDDHIEIYDWADCPKYTKTTLTAMLNETVEIHHDSRVKCISDASMTYEEVNMIRQLYIEKYKLRELVIEDSDEMDNIIRGSDVDLHEEGEILGTDEMMIQLLTTIDTEHISTDLLIEIYKSLKI